MNEYHLKLFKIIFREKYYFREVSARVNNDKQSLLLLPRVLEYVQKKIVINRLLYEYYKNEIYRILNFRNYSNTQRSESLMINRFREKIGSP